MTPQPRRKKWTEAEERTLIDKYGEMSCDGTLSKMKLGRKNMRHQYALVKQKIKKQESSIRGSGEEEFDWMEGITHWSNFLRYKELGQVPEGDFVGGIDGVENGVMDLEFDYDGEEGEENYNGGTKTEVSLREDAGARFICEDTEPNAADMRKKRKVLKGLEKKAWGFLVNQLGHLREMESQFEQREERAGKAKERTSPN
ncbi:hypothetical protein Sango_2406800 [Sesamum angolense]|uniref:Myb-like domain-containing protein n=1 Tax=Sesamum angolense TaxID=2727404 RepID=A0AAE1W780_9LAMI|nr:hypothetical protein Sango_2406800 [Sesamum angolense]